MSQPPHYYHSSVNGSGDMASLGDGGGYASDTNEGESDTLPGAPKSTCGAVASSTSHAAQRQQEVQQQEVQQQQARPGKRRINPACVEEEAQPGERRINPACVEEESHMGYLWLVRNPPEVRTGNKDERLALLMKLERNKEEAADNIHQSLQDQEVAITLEDLIDKVAGKDERDKGEELQKSDIGSDSDDSDSYSDVGKILEGASVKKYKEMPCTRLDVEKILADASVEKYKDGRMTDEEEQEKSRIVKGKTPCPTPSCQGTACSRNNPFCQACKQYKYRHGEPPDDRANVHVGTNQYSGQA